jgi:ariadne-1
MSDEEYLYDSGNDFSEIESDGECSDPEEPYSDYECESNKDDDDYPFEVLGEEKIAAQMSDSINEVKSVTMIPERRVKILLNYFKWDKHKLMERFCSESQDDIFQDIVPIQVDSAEGILECEICFDTFLKGMYRFI